MGYRLDVITDSIGEAVRYAGGLMFDRRRAGWDVVVITTDVAQSCALTILGARMQAPGAPDESALVRGGDQHTVVTSTHAFVCDGVELSSTRSQILLWGHQAGDGSEGLFIPVQHALSPAARAFKGHSLRSAGLSTEAEPFEHFRAHKVNNAALEPTGWPLHHGRAAPLSPELVGG